MLCTLFPFALVAILLVDLRSPAVGATGAVLLAWTLPDDDPEDFQGQ
ncbi:hypothetical protein N8J89_05785 [Crossiella sp. CA-258035]|nr:hypothetical protein [Crossiella sp. CA-258035]WHT20578.1 hypothetical protein N8J89_05785 [Crossiella sp. CA-258035]